MTNLLLSIRDALAEISSQGCGKPSMVIGSGWASRAAIHALLVHLDCSVVYLINRNIEKVKQVVEDMTRSGFTQNRSIIVVESLIKPAHWKRLSMVLGGFGPALF